MQRKCCLPIETVLVDRRGCFAQVHYPLPEGQCSRHRVECQIAESQALQPHEAAKFPGTNFCASLHRNAIRQVATDCATHTTHFLRCESAYRFQWNSLEASAAADVLVRSDWNIGVQNQMTATPAPLKVFDRQ